ncbi:MAG: hypothetical protein NPINA01_14160 [Nitrospinaceae bacterium]|nr:MAG: hypothetical protein NPINA01_14160 [Nitrospinaceae bacterium]
MDKTSQIRQVKKAVVLARKFHAGQVRKGPKGEAFYNHPRRVCKYYLTYKQKSIAGMLASICHDLVEDTALSIEEIEGVFGMEVREIVSDLTKPDHFSSEEYAAEIGTWSLESKKIKLCDIEDNILSSRAIDSNRRTCMLLRWKKYLDQLGKISSDGMAAQKEFRHKWIAVNKLHTEELKGLTAG